MRRNRAGKEYVSTLIHDNVDGWSKLQLTRDGSLVAEVVHWDAIGQFVIEMFRGELPLEIVEELIAEAKDRIRVR